MQPGELVIYRMNKRSSSPGRRAKNVRPNPKGESYTYQVDKYWIVIGSHTDGSFEIATRRGKRRIIEPNDEGLRRANWWERLLFSSRFPTPNVDAASDTRKAA